MSFSSLTEKLYITHNFIMVTSSNPDLFTNIMSIVPNIVSSGLGLISNAKNRRQQKEQFDKTFEYQKELNAKQYDLALQNFQLQQNAFDYEKQLQQDIFSREDSAVQRRALDLEAAGLSKTLAAGSGANAGSAINVSAPQMDYDYNNMATFSALMDVYNQQRQTSTQMALANAQMAQAYAEARKTNAEATVTEQTGTSSQIANILNTTATTQHTIADTNKISFEINKIVSETNYTNTNISRVLKEMDLTDSQIEKISADIESLVHQNDYYDSMSEKNKAELTGIYLKAIQTVYDINSSKLTAEEKEYTLSKWKDTGLPVLSSFPTVSVQGYGLGFGASYSGPWIPGSADNMSSSDFQTFVNSINGQSPQEIEKIWNQINNSDNGGEVYSDYPSYWKSKNKNK